MNMFEQSDRWEVSLDTLLPKGNHVVTITSADDNTNANKRPVLELRFENENGAFRAWEHYHTEFLNKIAALYDAAGIPVPQEGEFDPADNCRISEAGRSRLIGKTVGIVIRDEEDNRPDHKGEMRPRVKGYAAPSKVTGSADTRGLPEAGSDDAAKNKIPF